MKKKEIINILKPYWIEYLKKNGEFERNLQLEKFKETYNEMKKISFYSFFNFGEYISFRLNNYFIRKAFWDLSSSLAELKESEEELHTIKIKYKGYLTIKNMNEIEEKILFLQKTFPEKKEEYFKETLGSPDREIRLWFASEILKYL